MFTSRRHHSVDSLVARSPKLTVLLESGVKVAKNATELLQANLTEIGITLEIQTVDLTAFTATFYGDAPAEERPNLMWWGWWPDYYDTWNHHYPQVLCDARGSKGSNGGFYCNQQVEDLLTRARDAPDLEPYQQALSEIQQILSRDDPPSIYYVQPLWTSYVRKDIAGFVYNPINIGTFHFWRISRTV